MSDTARFSRGTIRFLKSLLALYFILLSILVLSVTSQSSANSVKRIVVVETMTLPLVQGGTEWFRKGMSDLGYTEGENVEYIVLNAKGNIDRAQNLLNAELEKQKPDMVISVATLASRATRKILKDQDIPQVFFFVADPIKEGFVSAIGEKSGTNITGRTHVVPAMAKIEVVKQSVKPLTSAGPLRVGIIHSSYPSATSDTTQLMTAAKNDPELKFIDLGFDYVPGEEGRTKMLDNAMELIEQRRSEFDALWFAAGPSENDLDFLKALKLKNIPILFSNHDNAVKSGALLAMVSNEQVNGTAAANLADQIFKGQDPSEIPITRPNTYIISLNITTATELGTVIPSTLLELAGKNIYR